MAWEVANTVSTIASSLALLLSGGSYAYTNHKAKKTARFQYRLDRWHKLEAEIREKLKSLESIIARFSSCRHSDTVELAVASMREIHRASISSHLALASSLRNAGKSDYSSDDEPWEDLAFQPRSGDNTSVDVIGEKLNALADVANLDEVGILATDVLAVWIQLIDGIETALRCENARLDPNYHNHI